MSRLWDYCQGADDCFTVVFSRDKLCNACREKHPDKVNVVPDAELALCKLVNEISGLLDKHEGNLRQLIGNTNTAVIKERVLEGRLALVGR